MPKVRLYNRDVCFHMSQSGPLSFNNAAYRNHAVWTRIAPKVYFNTANHTSDFDRYANNFAAAGLTGSLGETGAANWQFVAGATNSNIGRSLVYIADMHRAYYASRGINDYVENYAWWPGYAGDTRSSAGEAAQNNQWALYPGFGSGNTLLPNGNTSDYLTISSWTGSTASQLGVRASTPYIVAGLTAFQEWVRQFTQGVTAALELRATLAAPRILAGDFETPVFPTNFMWNDGDPTVTNGPNEVGAWNQALNDPRATTYKFFDRYTFFDLWGATGGSADWGRSPHQYTVPFGLTTPSNTLGFTGSINIASRQVDIYWDRRDNSIPYGPAWQNFYSSFSRRHREYLWARGWEHYRNTVGNSLIGNYQTYPSTRLYPDQGSRKVHGYVYTCDLGATGAARSLSGYNDPGVTGTFVLDYAAPVIYARTNTIESSPGYGAGGQVALGYAGDWGVGTPASIRGSGLFDAGSWQDLYINHWQNSAARGMTALYGGGTAEGYTGNNILDLRNFMFAYSKRLLDNCRGALDSFNDNASKPIIPWIGNDNGDERIVDVFGSRTVPDSNGLTGYTVDAWGQLRLDYEVALIKYAIQQHNVTDFLVFEPTGYLVGAGAGGLTAAVAIQSLDYWNDVVQTLLLDSASITRPIANIDVVSGRVARNTGSGGNFVFTGTGSSDPEGDPLTYQWRTNTGLSASGPTAAFVLPTGKHTVTLTVSDPLGVTGATSTQVLVHTNNSTKLRLYNQDVCLHGLPISPLQPRTQSWSTAHLNHRVWNYITPGISFRPDKPNPEFNEIAKNFASAGLTGSNGETGPGTWSFVAGQTAENYGRSVIYVADMYRAFYTSRGMTYDGIYAWWPSSSAEARGDDSNFHDKYALFPTVKDYNSATQNATFYPNGSTSDYLQISSWNGTTSTQLYVQACTPYIEAGLSAFKQWTAMVTRGITSALAVKPAVSAPKILANDFEVKTPFDHGVRNFLFFQNGLGVNSPEIGIWQQALNDPRAHTYKFFGRHTLFDLWGATGGSTQYGRSPHQWTIPYTVTAANNNTDILSVTSCPVDIIWDQRIGPILNTAPAFNNFITSLSSRHIEYLLSEGWKPFKNAFPDVPQGNYQNYPGTKRYPSTDRGKIHGYSYTCDVGATGVVFSNTGYTASDVTGTFALDYAGIELYPFDLDIRGGGFEPQNMLPGYGGGNIRYKYIGDWGVFNNIYSIVGPGVFNQGTNSGSYPNFVQFCSKVGMTGLAGGGTAQGYTGGNIIDYRNFILKYAKQALNNTRLSLDSFQDNTNKPIIPWIGDVDSSRTIGSIFSLTSSAQANSWTMYADVNGLTSVIYEKHNPFFLDYHVELIKYAIQTHNITDFFVFDASANTSTTADALVADEFWSDVAESLLIDSYSGNSSPNAEISVFPSNDQRDNTGTGVTFLLSATGSSDPDGDALTYAWNLSNGATAAGVTAAFTLTANNYTVNLLVTDAQGATSIDSTNILVRSNSAPTATITSVPDSTLVYDTNGDGVEAFVFNGINSSDPNGGSVTGYRWYVNGVTGATASSINVNLPLGTNTIVLVVTDNGGLTDDDTRIVTVSNPPERQNVTSKFSAMIVYRGRIYTREEFDNMLRTLYRDKFNTISKNIAPTRKQF